MHHATNELLFLWRGLAWLRQPILPGALRNPAACWEWPVEV